MVWLVLWGGLAYFTIKPSSRAPQALHDTIAGQESGEPSWIATIDRNVSDVLAHHGLEVSITFAIVLMVVAVGVFLPARAARVTLGLGLLVAAAIWVVGENFGTLFSRAGTDLNSGPLLALLALAYWPLKSARQPVDASVAASSKSPTAAPT